MKAPEYRRNKDKYCDYHKDKWHNTDECFHLKKQIEKMIKAGELNQFVSDLRNKLGPKEDGMKWGRIPKVTRRIKDHVWRSNFVSEQQNNPKEVCLTCI